MEYKDFCLQNLQDLWKVSDHNIELKTNIEVEFQNRILNNKQYSREDLFRLNFIEKKGLVVHFIPTSKSFNLFGENIIVDIEVDDVDKNLLLTNLLKSNPVVHTYGVLKAKDLNSQNITNDQINQLSTIGFNTEDILSVEVRQ